MRIYLAGKIAKNGWRNEIVNARELSAGVDLTEWRADPASDARYEWPVEHRAIFGEHDFTGPYFVSDDHGCAHGPQTHGAAVDGVAVACVQGRRPRRRELVALCFRAISRSDLVFAWLDSADAFGTFAELGFAAGRNLPIIIGHPPSAGALLDYDAWFVRSLATLVVPDRSAVDALRAGLECPDIQRTTFVAEARRLRLAREAMEAKAAPPPPAPAAPAPQGFVYFIQRGASGDIKIGYSDRPGRRLSALQTGSAEPLHLLATIPGGAALEHELHRRFAVHRVNGEWFRPAPEIFAHIAEQMNQRALAAPPRPTFLRTPPADPPLRNDILAIQARRAREALEALRRGDKT